MCRPLYKPFIYRKLDLKHGSIKLIPIAFAILLALSSSNGMAQDYKIGPGDQLQISFWEDPTLNVELKVGEDGMISLDIMGQIEAAGKTTKELQEEIAHGMSRLKREISQAIVRVTQYDYLYLFVSGQVRNGGRLTFEQIPDLWTVINLAGGIGESGDLSRVTIVRGGDQTGRVEVVNVAEAIANGTLDKLPKLRRGDTVDIPRTPGGIPSGDLSSRSGAGNYIYILGAVTTPGTVNFEPEMDLLQALAAAGGYVENADLGKVRVITNDGRFAQTLEFDLNKYMDGGTPARYILRRGDTFVVPHKGRGGFLGLDWGTIATVAGVVTSGILIYESVKPNEN